jgi:superfamily II DNA or RNA helicase
MPIQLRDYQDELISNLRAALRRSKRVLVQAPTGAGKTVLASYMIDGTRGRSQSAWFICHRAELVEGTSKTFSKFGIHHGIIAGGFPMDLKQLVQVCSIDTLKNRLASLQAPRITIIDEAHHSSAAGWALVVKWLHDHGTIIIGLSATPQRLDGLGLDAHFDEMVPGPAPSWLIERGHLAPYRIYAPSAPDMKGVRKQMGDFAKGETAARMDKPKLTGDAITHWRKYADGLRTVAFGVTRAHSMHITEQFNAAGIPSAHLDGDTNKGARKRIIQAYADGSIRVLTNVGLFGEGFDLSAIAQRDVTIDAVLDMAPTMSLAAYMQRGGRMLRPYPGKVGIYLDHAGNSARHGFFDDEREWTLEGKAKGGKAANDNGPPPPVTCDACFQQIRRPVPEFCTCGKRLQAEAKPIEVADGELKLQTEADKLATRQRLKQEQADCKTLDELVNLARKRGYKHPMKWAAHVHGNRRFAA